MNPADGRKPPPLERRPHAATPALQSPAGCCLSADAVQSVPRRWATTAVLAVLVSACSTGTAPNYIEPPSAEASAKVRVINTRPYAYYADIAIFDAIACFDRANIGTTGGSNKDEARIGMLGEAPPSSSWIERHVRANEPLVIGPRTVYPTATMSDIMHAFTPDAQEQMRSRQAGVCRIPSFVPQANQQYEVVIDLSPAHCTITPYHLTDNNGTVEREPIKVELSKISTYEFDMKCFR